MSMMALFAAVETQPRRAGRQVAQSWPRRRLPPTHQFDMNFGFHLTPGAEYSSATHVDLLGYM